MTRTRSYIEPTDATADVFIAGDPTASPGADLPIGSLATRIDLAGLGLRYKKTSAPATGWEVVSGGGSSTPTATTTVAGKSRVDNDSAGDPQALTAAGHLLDADPHPQYALDTEKGAASGLATLDASSKLTASQLPLGTSATTAAAGNDARLSDARTPTAHATSHQPGGSDAMAVDAAAGTGSLRTLGTSATAACAGNDSRLSDARTPTTHATTHKSGGSDAIKLDELAAPTDITTLNASTTAHGLLPKLDNISTHYLDGTGAWSTPPGGSVPTLLEGQLDPGSVTVETEHFVVHRDHLKLSSTNRLTMEGTSRFYLRDIGENNYGPQGDISPVTGSVIMGTPKVPTVSFTVPTDYQFQLLNRLELRGSMRMSLLGTADLYIENDASRVGRIVLTGRGN